MTVRDDIQPTTDRWIVWPISTIAAALTIAMIAIGTQFRPIADDYIHIGRVMEMGVWSSTGDWFVTFLPGFFGVLLISIFTGLYGVLPVDLAYLPYTAFLVSVLYLVGLTLGYSVTQSLRSAVPWLFAFAIPPLWLLSMGNVFPEYDVINAFGMMSWIANGYRAHLPLLIVVFIFAMNWWRHSRASGFVVGLLGMTFLTLNFLNALPDIAAYFALTAGTAGVLFWQGLRHSDATKKTAALVNIGMASGNVLGLAVLLLSPGTTSRTDEIPIQFSVSSALNFIPYQLTVFLREMLNISNAVVFIAAICLGLILVKVTGQTVSRPTLQRMETMAVQSIALTLLLLMTGVLGETLTYAAIFHRWVVLQAEFVAIVVVGLLIGVRYSTRGLDMRSYRWATAVLLVALLTSMIPLVNIFGFAEQRKQLWETGQPAPVSYMMDREQEMLQDWWITIEEKTRSATNE